MDFIEGTRRGEKVLVLRVTLLSIGTSLLFPLPFLTPTRLGSRGHANEVGEELEFSAIIC